MLYKTFALLLGSLVFATPLSPIGDTTLALGFESDVTFSRSFTTSIEIEATSVLIVAGTEHGGGGTVGLTYIEELRYTDTIGAMSNGEPTALTRVHEHIHAEHTIELPDETIEGTLTSPLEGETVIFKWDSDDEEWSMSLPEDSESEIAQDVLDDLTPDVDLLGLLPAEEVAVGDSWDVGNELDSTFSSPGGILPYVDEKEETQDLGAARQRVANNEAQGTATLRSVDDGIATIMVVMESTTSSEVEVEAEESEHGGSPEMTQLEEESSSYKALILWDIAAGYWTEISFEGTTTSVMDEVGTFESPDGAIEFVRRRTLEGEFEVSWTNELVE